MTTLTITHTSAEGTLIEGTIRGDGSAEILKANGWRWGRSIGSWYVPRSRDAIAKMHVINPTQTALTAAGFTVECQIDNTPRDYAEADHEADTRAEARAESLARRAERHEAKAENAYNAGHAIASHIPFGQPILVGHHSESRHRRDLAKIERNMRTSVNESREAEELARRAREAAAHHGARHNPVTVGNRITKLEADIRGFKRQLANAQAANAENRAQRLSDHIAQLESRLTYWRDVRAEQIATGVAGDYSPANVKKGDAVLIGGEWRTVIRANSKTVTVNTDYSWTARAEWYKVKGHRAAE